VPIPNLDAILDKLSPGTTVYRHCTKVIGIWSVGVGVLVNVSVAVGSPVEVAVEVGIFVEVAVAVGVSVVLNASMAEGEAIAV
jgi:hypothetical protein